MLRRAREARYGGRFTMAAEAKAIQAALPGITALPAATTAGGEGGRRSCPTVAGMGKPLAPSFSTQVVVHRPEAG